MIWRSDICFKRCVIGVLLLLALLKIAGAATVSGRVELVLSHDPNVRKHTDYSGVVVWLEPASGAPVIPAGVARAQMVQKNKTFLPTFSPFLWEP
jgi:hypothetical protein